MDKVLFKGKIVSSLYLGDVDPFRAAPRGQGIKGPISYWFRAMMGGIIPDIKIDELNHLEGIVFGNSKNQDSTFKINLEINEKTPQSKSDSSYLGGVGLSKREAGRTIWREAFSAGGEIELSITFFYPDVFIREIVISSLWMATNLGGFGTRSRRGFGTVILSDPNPEQASELDGLTFCLPQKAEDLDKHYKNNLKAIQEIFTKFAEQRGCERQRIKSIFQENGTAVVDPLPPYSCLCAGCWNIDFVKDPSWTNLHNTMSDLGNYLRNFRATITLKNGERRTSDYLNYINYFLPWPTGEKTQTGEDIIKSMRYKVKEDVPWDLRNDALGMPYQIRSKTRNLGTEVKWLEEGKDKQKITKEGRNRRASPLILRLLQLGDNNYAAAIISLKSKYLPDGATEWLVTSGRQWGKLKESGRLKGYTGPQQVKAVTDTDLCKIIDDFRKEISNQSIWVRSIF